VETATALKQLGREVTVFFIQNGVFATRKNADVSYLSLLTEAGITLLADGFSLRERGIEIYELGAGINESSIDTLIDLLIHENTKAIWH
jgi:predicted peroxiredoxin